MPLEVKKNLGACQTSLKMSPHSQGKGLPLGALERSPSRNREGMQSQERIVGTCAWAADPKGLRLAVQEGVVFQAAANVAAGMANMNVVHYIFSREGPWQRLEAGPRSG